MQRLGWHVNVSTTDAKRSVLAAPSHLKLLNTALDVDLVREWRQRCPNGLLVYRHVFSGGNDHDVQGRCDVLSAEAALLQPFGPVIVETPWNEERYADDLISAYRDDTVRAANLLHARGFRVAGGNFGVTWPTSRGFSTSIRIIHPPRRSACP